MTKIIDGKNFATEICKKLALETQSLKEQYNITPGLAVILVGSDPASQVYVGNKNKKAKNIGFLSKEILLPDNISEDALLSEINKLNKDKDIHGILVQLPLPKHINKDKVINAIDAKKDVDGFNIKNVGKLYTGQDSLVPCTPQGCLMLLEDFFANDLSGKNAVIIGRSNIVGRPMSELLLQKNCTTTIIHSKTKNMQEILVKADIIVAAVGIANFVTAKMIKDNAVIIDVGINRIKLNDKYKLVGDVDFSSVHDKVAAITPVPGGVGPMTIACLMKNTLKAAKSTIDD
ncbi:MAG: bifunctional methylenetetrahydrofolate dehydrogenase/methenyltetrahydrofolate cyclohydrolase FolD [Alphaproteobacteria bacterium]|nr:bifunctional methylenetetrahydrofolate dehydrogenase/methenyltetrahydrofolate cyclohydrolase FolD [Alphaproteobacteria bacterium]